METRSGRQKAGLPDNHATDIFRHRVRGKETIRECEWKAVGKVFPSRLDRPADQPDRVWHDRRNVADALAIRPAVYLSLVFDHRAVDGVPAANFLQELKRLLEKPQDYAL